MKAFALMSKQTGALMIGYRVTFLDQDDVVSPISDKMPWQFCLAAHQGWVIEFPSEVSPYPIFFNLEAECMFEVLGEL